MRQLTNRSTFAMLFTFALGGVSTVDAQTPAQKQIIGRWDITVQGTDGPYPSWLEVRLSGNRTLVGQFVSRAGSARPVAKVELSDGTIRFAIPPQWEAGTEDLRVEAKLDGDKLAGTVTDPDGKKSPWVGVRAPLLRRAAEPTWGASQALFNGKDLTGWEATGANQWAVVGGVLTNPKAGSNLVSKQTFTDFKLHVEFRYPKNGNSGIYLRGRHEVQIEDSGGQEPNPLRLGGVYGFLTANEDVAKKPGEWQTYDITLVGRMVTIVLNGKTIIARQEIPGITGGALNSDEGSPGPIYLQGDHTAVEYRSIVITPAR